ncbi:general secretion pathway protein GspA [Photobacterium proteolyticum]|uniref:General secretion pathway protein GspA n=1 Tax=Photobacterium proteolyticum TaxID=1903952 RepID=A0A1Q9GLU5_9GAMM|nr:XrtA/PEP-CTERM system-associated ATPase [Photobacterium proteolyticum]OLQ75514.1 general secretion pathway protein GspA [Photobacterium proteolyticum]
MYESHFGLSDKPFKLSPDPRFFFSSPHHEKATSYLKYGLSQGEGFIVITGPIGTGKTTIARNLVASLDDSIVAIQIATTRLTPEELVRLVAAKFGIPVEGLGKAEILKRLEQYLLTLHQQQRRALLLVDEAQNLPPETVEELRMLSNFQLDDKPLIQSFLLGQEELKGIIELPEMEQFRQRIIASCHLTPFDSEQTEHYILHRLNQVGWQGKPALSQESFGIITQYTQGVPRKINILVDRLFLYAYLEDLTVLKAGDVHQVLEEMQGELSGSMMVNNTLNDPSGTPDNSSNNHSSAAAADSSDCQATHTLHAVSEILDSVIERKVATIRHLDKLLTEKRKTLSAQGAKLHDETILEGEGNNDRQLGNEERCLALQDRYWCKELMAKRN